MRYYWYIGMSSFPNFNPINFGDSRAQPSSTQLDRWLQAKRLVIRFASSEKGWNPLRERYTSIWICINVLEQVYQPQYQETQETGSTKLEQGTKQLGMKFEDFEVYNLYILLWRHLPLSQHNTPGFDHEFARSIWNWFAKSDLQQL